jgi:phage-related protein
MPLGTNVGSVFFDIKANQSAFKKEIKGAAGQAQSVFSSAMGKVGKAIGVAFSAAAVVSFGKKCVEVASETQSAWVGLSSILNGQKKSFGEANRFIQDYISDGLVPLNNAVTAYKNLAARGYSTEQIEKTMTALKDAAAFGRQASYSYGDAISTATEGLKNENSILVDNAGVTKNVAKMWEDYAKSIGTTTNALTQQQKIEAEVNGIMEETKWQTGDAAKYATTFAGRVAKLSATFTSLKTEIGNVIIPILNLFIPAIQTALDALLKFLGLLKTAMASIGLEMPDVTSLGGVTAGATEAAEAIDNTGMAAEKAAKKVKKAFASYDEINVLSKSSSSDTSTGGSSGVAAADPTTSAITSGVSAVDSRLDELKEKLSTFWSGFAAGFEKEREELKRQIEQTKALIKRVWQDLRKLESPIKNWASTDLKDFFETFCHASADIFLGLYDSVNAVFRDLWNVAVYPRLQKFVTKGLPVLTQFSTECVKTLQTLFDSVKEIFDKTWREGAVPALQFFTQVYQDAWDIVYDNWQTYGAPIFDNVRTAIENTKNLFLNAWNNYMKPCWDIIMGTVTRLWTDHVKPLADNLTGFVGELIQDALEIYNKVIVPIVKWVQDYLYPKFVNSFRDMMNIVEPIIAGFIDCANGIITILKGIVQFLTGVFTGNWSKAWDGIKNIFKGTIDTMSAVIKTPLNMIIATFENLVNRIGSGINKLIRGFNSIKWNVPDWVPGIGGKSLGFNISQIPTIKLPRLAQGGWVAANNPQLAIVGDNTREGEIVSPESKIREQVELALAKAGGFAQKVKLQLELLIRYPDGRTIIKTINEAQIAEGRILLEV